MQRKSGIKKFFIDRLLPIVLVVAAITALIPKSLDQRIDDSIAKAKIFLADQNLDQDILGEYYPACLQNASKCPFDNETFLYKRIDASLDFVFLKDESFNVSQLEKKVDDSDIFLKNIVKTLPNISIDYSYIDSSRRRGDFALDLYCILGWTYNDTAIYRIIRNELKPYGWTNPNTTNFFRKVIDETWCISLLAENGEDYKIVKEQVDLKKREFYDFINGSEYLDRKILAGTHILLMFSRLKSYGYDISQYSDFIKPIEYYIIDATSHGKLNFPLEVYHNVLYSLIKARYEDKEFLQELTEKILQMQNKDGSWVVSADNRFRILVTLRSAIAINLFKTTYLK